MMKDDTSLEVSEDLHVMVSFQDSSTVKTQVHKSYQKEVLQLMTMKDKKKTLPSHALPYLLWFYNYIIITFIIKLPALL